MIWDKRCVVVDVSDDPACIDFGSVSVVNKLPRADVCVVIVEVKEGDDEEARSRPDFDGVPE